MQRRDFLKLSATVGSSARLGSMLTGCSEPAEWQLMMNAPPATETATVCNICFWSCAARVHTQGSRLWKITGQPGDPHSDGRLCTRGTGGVGAYYDPNRLVKPLLRVTRNGQQRFEVASWDDALGVIAERLTKMAKTHGPDRLASLVHGPGAQHFAHLSRASPSRRARPNIGYRSSRAPTSRSCSPGSTLFSRKNYTMPIISPGTLSACPNSPPISRPSHRNGPIPRLA